MVVDVHTFFHWYFTNRTKLVGTLLQHFLAGIAFVHSIEAFIALRIVIAGSTIAFWTIFFVYVMELIGGNWKTWLGIGFEFPWALAYSVIYLT